MTSDQRIKAEMDKKRQRSNLAGADAGAYNFAMAKIELSDTSFIAVQIIKNSFLSPNPEGLQFFILAIVPRATNSRCCCF